MPTVPINILVAIRGGQNLVIDINPDVAHVPNNGSSGNQNVLNWFVPNGSKGTITDFFWADPNQQPLSPPVVTGFPGTMLQSAPYTNNSGVDVQWAYTITVTDGTDTASIDPTVDNEPPG